MADTITTTPTSFLAHGAGAVRSRHDGAPWVVRPGQRRARRRPGPTVLSGRVDRRVRGTPAPAARHRTDFPKRLLLGDHVIHELDIALALGRQSAVEAEAFMAVLNTQVRVPNPFVPAAARARGLNLLATEADWAHGAGPLTVTGGAAHLASVLAGRTWALDRPSGAGVDELRARLAR